MRSLLIFEILLVTTFVTTRNNCSVTFVKNASDILRYLGGTNQIYKSQVEDRKARVDFGIHRLYSWSPAKFALDSVDREGCQWFVREGWGTRPSSAEAHSSVTCHSLSGWGGSDILWDAWPPRRAGSLKNTAFCLFPSHTRLFGSQAPKN